MAISNKSNINWLQEELIKKGYVPIYEERNIDKVTKQFVCVVSYKKFKATGTGNSKKEAKLNAATNMLSLLVEKNEILLPVAISSSLVTNVVQTPAKLYDMFSLHQQVPAQSPTKVYEMSSSHQQSVTACNYVGKLQEFCQQQQINVKNIIYNVVYEEGPSHMRTFTIEVSLGPLRERGMASCKKSAKQEAARKLLMHLEQKLSNSNVVQNATEHSNGATPNANLDHLNVDLSSANTTNLNVASLDRTQSNGANTIILKNNININDIDRETLKNIIRGLGTEISDSVTKETSTIAELTEEAKSLYIESFNKKYNKGLNQNTDSSEINNFHTLFERNYSSKIPYYMREKMRTVRDSCIDKNLMCEIGRDLENLLEVELQRFPVCNTEHKLNNDHIMCVRLLSNPRITQIGMGETKTIAESRAMYSLITAILTLLNA